ncbi:MAG: DUF805 domain-containing protein [Prevotellaceae bacterium]|nr:DUF805 domain-containing protein [Prevotellaceae bacterium]
MMTFKESVRKCFTEYATFKGRASRPEFWWFFLANFVLQVLFWALRRFFPYVDVVTRLITILLILPNLAVSVRRMHDTERCGWWVLLPIVNLIFWALPGTPGENRFGAVVPEHPVEEED